MKIRKHKKIILKKMMWFKRNAVSLPGLLKFFQRHRFITRKGLPTKKGLKALLEN